MCLATSSLLQVGASRMFAYTSCALIEAYDQADLHKNVGNHTCDSDRQELARRHLEDYAQLFRHNALQSMHSHRVERGGKYIRITEVNGFISITLITGG